jgi:O-methyltransferase involved in polyketide biosynthesis
MINDNADISSAEMTAYWRSFNVDTISGDNLSHKLATTNGINQAKAFEKKYNYPLVSRKVEVRARFFLDNAVHLLKTGNYDSCISLASGFSLLTYYIFKKTGNLTSSIEFIDTDIDKIIEPRKKRLKCLVETKQIEEISLRIKQEILDLEMAANKKLSLKEVFPSCKNPLFIIEGVIYFLSTTCVEWLMREIKKYNNSALIFDYWPEEGIHQSKFFERTVTDLRGFMKENIVSFFNEGFWGEQNFPHLMHSFKTEKNIPIDTAEKELAGPFETKLNNPDEFFPVKLYIGVNNRNNMTD